MAIVMLQGRPALRVENGDFGEAPKEWPELEDGRENVIRAIGSVGRLIVHGHPLFSWIGTGFFAGPSRVLTARNVAQNFATGRGERHVQFREGHSVTLEQSTAVGHAIDSVASLHAIRFIHPALDIAAFEVHGLETGDDESDVSLDRLIVQQSRAGLVLAAHPPDSLKDRPVAVVGFAAPDARNPQGIPEIFGKDFDSLRIQPGRIIGVKEHNFQGAKGMVIQHDCSTLAGCGGAPLIDLLTGEVLGVHFAGMHLAENYAVPTWELGRDRRVREHGLRFSDEPSWMSLWDDGEPEPPPTAPPLPKAAPKKFTTHFPHKDVLAIFNLLIAAGLGSPHRLRNLFGGMDPGYVATLPTPDTAADQLLEALHALNRTPTLTTGELPMEVLLLNAVQMSGPRAESAELESFLERLRQRASSELPTRE